MVHLAPQLHDLIVGTRSLIELFGQVEVLVVELGIVLGELVQLLLQVGDDLWGGDGRRERGEDMHQRGSLSAGIRFFELVD